MDICDRGVLDAVRGCDAVIHFAAESHVDRSIEDASAFVRTNVEGTHNLHAGLPRSGRAALRARQHRRGVRQPGRGRRVLRKSRRCSPTALMRRPKRLPICWCWPTCAPTSFPAMVTRCSNNYGPYQFPEKFIPLMIAQAMAGERLPVYGKGANVRDWIHVNDHCERAGAVLQQGREGEVYNIGGGCEMRNLDVAQADPQGAGAIRRPDQFVTDRPGHDLRYAINCEKLAREMGWHAQDSLRSRAGEKPSTGIATTSTGWTMCARELIASTSSGTICTETGRLPARAVDRSIAEKRTADLAVPVVLQMMVTALERALPSRHGTSSLGEHVRSWRCRYNAVRFCLPFRQAVPKCTSLSLRLWCPVCL